MQVEIILAEFGADRQNAGGGSLPLSRFEPSLSSFRKYFPDAMFTFYTDQDDVDVERGTNVRVRKLDPPFDKNEPRYGWRANDWAQGIGLMRADRDIAIAIDSDLLCVNQDVQSIIPLCHNFGMCMPSNGRHIVWRDSMSECDGGNVFDKSLGCGMSRCTAFWALSTRSEMHLELIRNYVVQIEQDAKKKRGARGPLSLWRAEWSTRISPYGLPREWCITGSNLGDLYHKGRTVPIILHVGHESVREHYKEIIEAQE